MKARMLLCAVLEAGSAAALADAVNQWLAEAAEKEVVQMVPAGDLAIAIFYTEG
jgi:hypothetical protein